MPLRRVSVPITLTAALVAVTTQAGVFLASGLLLLSIRHREPLPPTAADRRPLRAELTDGFRALFGQPILRALALSNALIGFGSGAVGGGTCSGGGTSAVRTCGPPTCSGSS